MPRSKPTDVPRDGGPSLSSLDDVIVIVIGDRVWGRGPDVETAHRNARKPKKYIAYLAHSGSSVDEVSGGILYPLAYPPRELFRKGLPRATPAAQGPKPEKTDG